MTWKRIVAWLVIAPSLLLVLAAITYLMWPLALLIFIGLIWSWINRRSRGEEYRMA